MFDYLEAEWGDYIRKHATHYAVASGLPYKVARACVKVNILRHQTPDDLAEQMLKEAKRWPS